MTAGLSQAAQPRVLILQRVIPSYRVGVFQMLTAQQTPAIQVVIGTDVEGAKARNAPDLSRVKHVQLPSRCVSVLGRPLFLQRGLLRVLRHHAPDVIVCEAESHFFGYLTAILYKLFFAPRTKLILWCYYYLPGAERDRSAIHALTKTLMRRFFSHFISYASFGRDALVSRNIDPRRITVAMNVCDTPVLRQKDMALKRTREEAKLELGLGRRFVVSYVGTLDVAKRPLLLVEIAELLRHSNIHILVVGSGPLEEQLRNRIAKSGLANITAVGRVSSGIERYYRATDVVAVPGRGGIVISEALCFGVPVVAHQADGVEIDLLQRAKCGLLLASDDAQTFASALEALARNPEELARMQANALHTIDRVYNTEAMARSVVSAIESVGR